MIFICYFLSSCTTSQKIVVNGTPGTEIYSPTMEKLATIESNGKTKIKLSSDGYYAYLMSHQPSTWQFVPFALDYKHKGYIGNRLLKYTGYTISAAGVFADLVGCIALLSGAEDVGAPFLIGGSAAIGLGTAIGMPADFRSHQTQYGYRFKYLTNHVTNQDINFSQIIDNGYNKNIGSKVLESTGNPQSENGNADVKGTVATRKRVSVSTKTIKVFTTSYYSIICK